MGIVKRRMTKVAAALLVAAAGFLAACATAEPRNVSSRPWNAPKGWEHGIPTTLMEGR